MRRNTLSTDAGATLAPAISAQPATNPPVNGSALRLNYDLFIAEYHGRSLDLTRTEFELLAVLLRERHRVRSREFLHAAVWENGGVKPRAVDTFISRLRAKLRSLGHSGIAALRNRGYRLLDD